jgi:AcrR family transcriptional regulator
MTVRGKARAAILNTARALFAQRGFHGTSVGLIARRAKVDRALINYYFESKAKLFAAAIAPRISVQRPLPITGGASAGHRIAVLYLERLFPDRDEAIAAMLRAGLADPDSVPELNTLIRETFALGQPDTPPSHEAQLRAELVAAQILGVFVYRRLLGDGALATAAVNRLVAQLGPVVDDLLRTPSPSVS